MKTKEALTGLNVQFPISQALASGEKIVETRTYPLPEKYLNVRLVVIETPGKAGKFKARALGLVTFEKCFRYPSEAEFYRDYNRHRVDSRSPGRWTDEKPKWGWQVGKIELFDKPKPINQRKGIVFTSNLKLR